MVSSSQFRLIRSTCPSQWCETASQRAVASAVGVAAAGAKEPLEPAGVEPAPSRWAVAQRLVAQEMEVREAQWQLQVPWVELTAGNCNAHPVEGTAVEAVDVAAVELLQGIASTLPLSLVAVLCGAVVADSQCEQPVGGPRRQALLSIPMEQKLLPWDVCCKL